MQLFPSDALSNFTDDLMSNIGENMPAIIGLVAFIVGLSIVMAVFDTVREEKSLSRRSK